MTRTGEGMLLRFLALLAVVYAVGTVVQGALLSDVRADPAALFSFLPILLALGFAWFFWHVARVVEGRAAAQAPPAAPPWAPRLWLGLAVAAACVALAAAVVSTAAALRTGDSFVMVFGAVAVAQALTVCGFFGWMAARTRRPAS